MKQNSQSKAVDMEMSRQTQDQAPAEVSNEILQKADVEENACHLLRSRGSE